MKNNFLFCVHTSFYFYFLFFHSFSFLRLSLLTASPSLFSSSKPFFLPPQIHHRSAQARSQPCVGRGLSFGCCSKKRAMISTTTIIAIDGLNLAYRYEFRLGWVMAYLIITFGHIKRTPIRVQIGWLGLGCSKKRAAISTITIIAIDGLNLAYWYGSGLGWAVAHLIITSRYIKRTPIRV